MVLQSTAGDKITTVAELRLYALADDLFTPHAPTRATCTCTPIAPTAGSRRPMWPPPAAGIGLDFMAITDHRQYAPSLEAMRAFEGLPSTCASTPARRCTRRTTPCTWSTLAAASASTTLFEDAGLSRRGRGDRRSAARLPGGVDRYTYASCVWCFRADPRAAAGWAFFATPTGLHRPSYDVPGT